MVDENAHAIASFHGFIHNITNISWTFPNLRFVKMKSAFLRCTHFHAFLKGGESLNLQTGKYYVLWYPHDSETSRRFLYIDSKKSGTYALLTDDFRFIVHIQSVFFWFYCFHSALDLKIESS